MPLGAGLSGVLIERFGAVGAIILFSGWLFLLAAFATLNRHVRNAVPIERTKLA